MEFNLHSSVKCARREGVGTESEGEELPLQISFSGAPVEEAASSPTPRRRQRRENDKFGLEGGH